MRIIAQSTLKGFVRKRVDPALRRVVQGHLDIWYLEALRAEWRNSAELKAQHGSASILSADRVVFNIKGNDFRLVAAISYEYLSIRVLWLGTHREYDSIDAKEVRYDKRRYHDPSDPDGRRP